MTTQSKTPRPATLPAEPDPVVPEPPGPLTLRLSPVLQLTGDQFLALCALNDALRIELNAQGELEILPPANITAGSQNASITARLFHWAEADGRGVAFDSSAGFTLPNGAVRSPDAAWVLRERLAELPEEQKVKFAAIAPDFVIELRSSPDSLNGLQAKLQEYVENGVRLGWLIDSLDSRRRVYIYRPNAPVAVLEGLDTLSGEPELPGFTLDLKPVWEPAF